MPVLLLHIDQNVDKIRQFVERKELSDLGVHFADGRYRVRGSSFTDREGALAKAEKLAVLPGG